MVTFGNTSKKQVNLVYWMYFHPYYVWVGSEIP